MKLLVPAVRLQPGNRFSHSHLSLPSTGPKKLTFSDKTIPAYLETRETLRVIFAEPI